MKKILIKSILFMTISNDIFTSRYLSVLFFLLIGLFVEVVEVFADVKHIRSKDSKIYLWMSIVLIMYVLYTWFEFLWR